MKIVNAKIFAFKYWLIKKLNASLENDKKAIKEGATITFKDYCKIQVVECTKKSYTKEAQEKIDKFAEENHLEKVETKYTRIDIDKIPIDIENDVNEMLEIIENNSNDRVATRVASAVAKHK